MKVAIHAACNSREYQLFSGVLGKMGIISERIPMAELAHPPFHHSVFIIPESAARRLTTQEIEASLRDFTFNGGRVLLMGGGAAGPAAGPIERHTDRHRILSHPNQVAWEALAENVGELPAALIPDEAEKEALLSRGGIPILLMSIGSGPLGEYHFWSRMKILHCGLPLPQLAGDPAAEQEALKALENILWWLFFSGFIVGFGLYDHKGRRPRDFRKKIEDWELPPVDLRPMLAPARPKLRHELNLQGTWHFVDAAAWNPEQGGDFFSAEGQEVTAPGPLPAEGWAGRKVNVPKSWVGGRVHLYIKGLRFFDLPAWVNGRRVPAVGSPSLGVDITELISPGENTIVVESKILSATKQVSLVATPSVWIDDLYVQPNPGLQSADVTLWLRNESGGTAKATVLLQTQPYRFETGSSFSATTEVQLPPDGKIEAKLTLPMPKALTWSPEQPNLHWLRATLTVDGKPRDDACLNFGMRTLETRDGDFYLNGRRIFLFGSGSGGTNERDLRLLKFIGANVCSWVHSREEFEACDCSGFLVIGGGVDLEAHALVLTENYGRRFKADWKKTVTTPKSPEFVSEKVREMTEQVIALRNHPSLAAWYVSGEVPAFFTTLWEHVYPRLYQAIRDNDPQDRLISLCNWVNPYDSGTRDFEVGWFMDESEPCRRLHEAHPDVLYDSHPYTGFYNDYQQIILKVPSQVPDRFYGIYETGSASLPYSSGTNVTEPEFERRTAGQVGNIKYWTGPRPSHDEYAEASQDYQCAFLEMNMDHFRMLKPQVDFWINLMLHDSGNQKGLIDAFGNLKRSFWVFRELAKPVVVALQSSEKVWRAGDDAAFMLRVVNDELRPLSGKLQWEIQSADGTLKAKGNLPMKVAADAVSEIVSVTWPVPAASKPAFHYLLARFLDRKGQLIASREHEFLIIPPISAD